MNIRFEDRVAIVTGAGSGLGRAHALALAARGAKVVVNDFGGAHGGNSPDPAQTVVDAIVAAGGEAMTDGADVTNPAQVEAMVAAVLARWGRIDILINNAGILRDVSFQKMTLQDFTKVLDVHLIGAFHCCKAVWPAMKERGYGRILMTTSPTGMYGNFGQANYGAAKAGLVGLMNVLHVEGAKNDIRVNTLCPSAATQMTAGMFPGAMSALMAPEHVTPAALFLVSEDAPRKTILAAGAGGYAKIAVLESDGIFLEAGTRTPEAIADRFDEISDLSSAQPFDQGSGEVMKFLTKAAAAAGIELPSRDKR